MPELPEVQVVVNSLKTMVVGKVIKKISFLKSKLLKEITEKELNGYLKNKSITNVTRIAKFIVFKIGPKILLSHLRMEGKYYFYSKPTKPSKHHWVIFYFTDGSQLHYQDTRMFGTFHLRTSQNYKTILPISKIAAEPWEIKPNYLYQKLSQKNIAIKTALLDQTIIAGLGNIYVDEVLYTCKIHPKTKSSIITINQVKKIIDASKKIFEYSIKLGGSSINSYTSVNAITGRFQNKLQVHLRKDQPCFICKSIIIKIKVNGRGAYYCPKCQKLKLK